MMERHPVDLISLTFGLLFAVVGLVLVTGTGVVFSIEWVAPVAAIVVGGVLIIAARPTHTTPDVESTPD